MQKLIQLTILSIILSLPISKQFGLLFTKAASGSKTFTKYGEPYIGALLHSSSILYLPSKFGLNSRK